MKKIIYCNITPKFVFITVRYRWLYFLEYDVDYFAERGSITGTVYGFKKRSDGCFAHGKIDELYAAYAAQQQFRGEENANNI